MWMSARSNFPNIITNAETTKIVSVGIHCKGMKKMVTDFPDGTLIVRNPYINRPLPEGMLLIDGNEFMG